MLEITLVNQYKNVENIKLQAKPSMGEIINLPHGRWGIVSRVDHFDGGRTEVCIDEAPNAKIVRRRL